MRRTCDGKENGVNLLDPCVARPAAHPPARVHRVHRALRGRTHPPRTPWPRRSRCPHLVAIMALLCTQGTDMLGAVPQGAWPRPVRGPWSPAYAARPGAEGGKTKGLSPPRARARAHTHTHTCMRASMPIEDGMRKRAQASDLACIWHSCSPAQRTCQSCIVWWQAHGKGAAGGCRVWRSQGPGGRRRRGGAACNAEASSCWDRRSAEHRQPVTRRARGRRRVFQLLCAGQSERYPLFPRLFCSLALPARRRFPVPD